MIIRKKMTLIKKIIKKTHEQYFKNNLIKYNLLNIIN